LKHWHPIWLRKAVLFSFMALFLLLALTLIALKHFVDRNQGLSLRLTANHYSWTYGPTVLLVVVVGLWRRVNYYSMVNQPWQELANGPKPADKTVLLDYLSPPQIISFITAMQNGHYAVAASTLIFALFKIIIVISTTLFLLGMSVFSREVQLRRGTKFDLSLFRQMAISLNLVFAGSRFLDEIRGEEREKPNGGEEEGEHGSARTDGSMTVAKELIEAQEGKRFRLGWWDDTRGDAGLDIATSRDTVFAGESRDGTRESLGWYGIDLVRKGGSEG
jgi:hypothetical protein